ncbi:uracil-DNA glycosylase family protein [Patiriisocius hiemis]|uniref:Uracil-DNA glycosylase family protein n=1 Tax=Patiriisocius hiemis TaxID=3075604 RepID=A0ABU2YFM8_9FLAO|nr:uracil-DNA glycosylase family protein [Constantimarinum sp. W242]MDT0556827.1 uracil-DNA glycosylase family protein [Constantimarinum sp. W242]
MFLHTHPYPPYIPKNATKLIVGTLPPPRFTTGELNSKDVDFCYGSSNGLLWPILNKIFELDLLYEDSKIAIKQRKDFLNQHGIGVCDIVSVAKRKKIDASDLGMQNVVLRDMIAILKENPKIDTLLFMGGNSKNGPEYFFRRHLKIYNLKLEIVSDIVPRIHRVKLPSSKRIITTVSLTAPSGAANRAIGSMDEYKLQKQKNLNYTTLDFRIAQYAPFLGKDNN